MDKYINEMLEKIDSKTDLTESELRDLIFDFNEVDQIVGEDSRWSRFISTIVEIGGRTFMVDWDMGLTEMQEHEFYNQPVEVKKHEYEKTVKVVEWKPIAD